MEKGRILLNIMYTGKYISEYNKIGHEIINLFKADDGNNYIYVTPYGTVNEEVDIVLMGRSIGGGRVEILGKADGLENMIDNKGENIEYCGYALKDIMSEVNGEAEERYITFKCARVIKPLKSIVLTTNKDEANFIDGVKRLANMSMKNYFNESDKGYRKLKEIINNQELWEKENTTIKVKIEDVNVANNKNFLSIIGKKDDELVFSNLLAYYLSEYSKIFISFANEILELDNIEHIEYFDVQREKWHIDILITTNKHVVVIENKIRSDINGVNGEFTQLSKYYEKAKEIANGRDIRCFIFCPNYHNLNLEGFKDANKYKIIKYKALYNFFASHGEYAMYDRYYGDFLSAIKLHTKTVYNDWEEVIKNKFSRGIRKLREKDIK